MVLLHHRVNRNRINTDVHGRDYASPTSTILALPWRLEGKLCSAEVWEIQLPSWPKLVCSWADSECLGTTLRVSGGDMNKYLHTDSTLFWQSRSQARTTADLSWITGSLLCRFYTLDTGQQCKTVRAHGAVSPKQTHKTDTGKRACPVYSCPLDISITRNNKLPTSVARASAVGSGLLLPI